MHLALEEKYDLSVLRIQRVYRGKLGRRRSAKLAEIKARQKLLDMALSGISKKRGSVFEKCKKESEEKERTLSNTLAVNKAAVAKRNKESGATKSSGSGRQKKRVGRGAKGERNGARRRM